MMTHPTTTTMQGFNTQAFGGLGARTHHAHAYALLRAQFRKQLVAARGTQRQVDNGHIKARF